MAPQKGECGKKKGKVRKNTVKVHKDVQEYSTDKTCGARERKNARNSITKVVSLSISKVILLNIKNTATSPVCHFLYLFHRLAWNQGENGKGKEYHKGDTA